MLESGEGAVSDASSLNFYFDLVQRDRNILQLYQLALGSLDAQVGGEEAGGSSGGAVGGAAPGADAEVAREVAVALNILSTSV